MGIGSFSLEKDKSKSTVKTSIIILKKCSFYFEYIGYLVGFFNILYEGFDGCTIK